MSEQKKINVLRGRKLSLDGAIHTGTGATCKVYVLPDDNIVKVLNSCDTKEAEREIQLSKWAFAQGIPTAISYDVVDVDGHPGLVYESLGRGNLRNELRDNPDQFNSIMERYLKLLKTINSITVENGQLPSTKKQFLEKLLVVKERVTEKEYLRILELVGTIPESDHLIHGDCHIKNVKVRDNELFLIDLDTLSVGDPIFELMGLCCCYKAYSNGDGKGYNVFFDIDNKVIVDTYNYILYNYYDKLSKPEKEDNIRKIELLTYIYMLYCLNPNSSDEKSDFDDMYSKVKKDLLNIDNFILKH